jgi:hypothetical protein
MSKTALQSLEEIRARMAEAFGKRPCKIEISVDEAIAVKLAVEDAIKRNDDAFIVNLLKLVPMRIQQGLDGVKP